MLWLFVVPTGVYLLDFFCSGTQFYLLLSPYLLDFFCSGTQFYLLLSPYLCLVSLLYLDLYVLGDDALIS